jgi:nicotinamide mononucleotide adenylyltransferase
MPPLVGVRVRKFGFVSQNNLARVRRAAPNFTAILAHDAWRQVVFDFAKRSQFRPSMRPRRRDWRGHHGRRIASGEIEGAKGKFYLDCFDR